jgi:large subunit ribosomal protein L11
MIKHIITLKIFAHNAESTPPLGTVLGNLGVNAVKFCKEFNEFTLELPEYFQLNVKIYIYEAKNFSFEVELPSIGFLISLLKVENLDNNREQIFLSELIMLAQFKFPIYSLIYSLPIIIGSLNSTKIELIDDCSINI